MQIMNVLAVLPALTLMLVAACKLSDIYRRDW